MQQRMAAQELLFSLQMTNLVKTLRFFFHQSRMSTLIVFMMYIASPMSIYCNLLHHDPHPTYSACIMLNVFFAYSAQNSASKFGQAYTTHSSGTPLLERE